MQEPISQFERVIGLDSHPDSFTAALVRGPTPAAAVVEKMFNKVPLSQLTKWAQEHTTPADLCVLEASGNSFYVARSLEASGRRARVLESTQLGRLKEAHANNDKLSAERIAKAYLAGTTKSVWVPDLRTQERRDCFHAYEKVTKRTTQLRNRLKSYLSDQGVRLAPDTALNAESLRPLRTWSTRQWQIVAGLLLELRHAEEQDEHWRSFMAQEVLEDPQLLALVRQCGVADVVAFAVGAIVGDIHRFARPGSLVKYAGLNPACDDSGNGQWHGGIGGHGRRDLRALPMEAAPCLLR